MLAKADKPDDTSDQLSVVSWDVFGLPSHNFNCTSKNNKRTATVSTCYNIGREQKKKQDTTDKGSKVEGGSKEEEQSGE